MKILKTLLNPLSHLVMLCLLVSFSSSFAQNQNPAMTLDKIVETSFEVKDFDVWKPLFLKDSLIRRQQGIETIVISSKIGHPRQMMNVSMVKDFETAKASMKDPEFLKKVTARGVVNPKAEYYEVLRFNPDAKESRWVVMNHKVKDYDAWVAAYDQGKTLRSDAGLIDVLIARNIDHPSMIQVVLDITDLNKAKAFMTSEILKDKMKSAGVIGKPDIEYYEGR